MKVTLKRNLFFGLGLALSLLLISSIASYIAISDLIRSSKMVRQSNQNIENLNSVLSILKDAETGQRGFILTGEPAFLTSYNEAKTKISELENLIEISVSSSDLQKRNLKQLHFDIDKRMEMLALNLQAKKINGKVANEDLMKGKDYMDNIRAKISSMKEEEQQLLQTRTSSLNRLAGFTPLLIILAALLAIVITLFFYKRVVRDFNEKSILQEDLERKTEETHKRITAIEKVASQISEGDYKIRFSDEMKDGLGSLTGSLNSMAKSLQYSFNLLEDKEWMQSGIALLNDTMVGEKNATTLADDILEKLSDYTESHVGALYILAEDNLLHLSGQYALPENAKKILQIGESIPGQCFQSGKQILLDNIPGDEATISYASGKTKSKTVVAVPLLRENKPIGVIELGSLKQYSQSHLEFFKSISDNIGLAFYSSQNRKKMQELLEELQSQTEELQLQHSELENINAELEAQTQKVLASEEELRVQQEELLQSNQELEERTTLLGEKNQLIEERNFDIQQKSEQLIQSTKYKSEFLANMSHELRTPLNSILLLSKLMAESKDLDKQYVEYADVMQSSGQGLLTLIDEILDLSKIEAGKMTLELSDVLPGEVAADMDALFMPVAKNKKLDLRITVEENVPPVLQTDKLRLEQILRNLLSNAIKFTSSGYVSLEILKDDSNKKIIFKVADTGIGIAKDKQKLVFEAFQQADGSTRRKFGGTGLGLSISRELAGLLGGTISLKSSEGAGSEFTLFLPIQRDRITEDQKIVLDTPLNRPAEKPAKQPKRYVVDHIPHDIQDDRDSISVDDKLILIIEDDTAFAKILLDFARQKNYKGLVAVRGDTGIEMANHFKPLAILLDIQLPVIDGWQVMENLKSNSETRHIPVHIMSSMKVKQESLLKGAVDFINKPIALERMQMIFKKLEDALSRSLKKVLIVEENEHHAKALAYFLSANNINTEIANDIEHSIRALKKHEINCVILDMGVPDKNAYKSLETIKEQDRFENLPIIIFTGRNLSKGEETRIKKYADSIVVKTAYSYQRILDEAALFLHLVEEKNKKDTVKSPFGESFIELRNVLKNKNVLIADDDVRNIFSLTKALEIHNMKVFAATDGKEALKVLNENPTIDVVLMDMMMPEMDGYETIREIRSSTIFKHLPVFAVTAKAMMGDREKCIAVGASDYISKPVDVDQLVSLLRVWLNSKN